MRKKPTKSLEQKALDAIDFLMATMTEEQREAFRTIREYDQSILNKVIESHQKISSVAKSVKEKTTHHLDKVVKAREAYKEPGKRQDERARAVLRILEFTDGSGKRPVQIDKRELFTEYVQHIQAKAPGLTNNQPIDRAIKAEAIYYSAAKREMTYQAVQQHLKLHIIYIRRKLRANGENYDDLLRHLSPPTNPPRT